MSTPAGFNGGFRFEQIRGGYKSEGREVQPLVKGQATLAIDTEGRLQIAFYRGLGTPTRTPVLVDRRMGNAYCYVNGSKKDFIALFACS